MNSNTLYTCDINDINEFLPIYYIIVVHQWRIVWNYIYIYIYIYNYHKNILSILYFTFKDIVQLNSLIYVHKF